MASMQAPDQVVNMTFNNPEDLVSGTTASINIVIDQYAAEATPLLPDDAVQYALGGRGDALAAPDGTSLLSSLAVGTVGKGNAGWLGSVTGAISIAARSLLSMFH